jgi:type II secretory pathway pseudopilin PulG
MKFHPTFRAHRRRAFTLLEVMIAIAIFFVASFSILELVSQSLANARRLERPLVDASVILSQISLTNQLVENNFSGYLGDLLGKTYANYNWSGVIVEVQSNHLYSADFTIQNAGNGAVVSRTATLFYRPQSPAGSLDGGNFIK